MPFILSLFSLFKYSSVSLRLRVEMFYPTKPYISSHKPTMLKKNTNFLLQINNYYLTLQQFH